MRRKGLHRYIAALLMAALMIALAPTGFGLPDEGALESYAASGVRGEISFDRILNARDLGGYKTKDGRVVKKKMLLRTGELSYASAADVRKLSNVYHVGTVIDLRYSTDHKYCKDKTIKGAKNVNIPAKYKKHPKKSTAKKRFKRLKKKKKSALLKSALKDYNKTSRSYTVNLVTSSYSKKQYREFFNKLLENDGKHAVLFHCICGKDRTGVAAFMTLVALGVDEETAYKDYSLTNQYLKNRAYSKYKKGKIGVRESDLRYAVKKIKKQYGSLDAFLEKAYGLDAAKREKLRAIYTE